MKELITDNLKSILAENDKVIVQYGAAWCGACRLVKPQFIKLANEYEEKGIEFYYVDAEKFPQSRTLANVENLPMFATFKSGELMKQVLGSKIEKVKEAVDEIASN
jgi:thiol-disulfide isomerase/thioredoxin